MIYTFPNSIFIQHVVDDSFRVWSHWQNSLFPHLIKNVSEVLFHCTHDISLLKGMKKMSHWMHQTLQAET